MTQHKAPAQPDWPRHHSDAPPPRDPHSLRRGILAGASVLMIALAVLAAGGLSSQMSGVVVMLAWIGAVGFGALAYRGRPPVVLTLTKISLVLGIASMALAVLLLIVGAEVRQILVGTVTFGTSGSGCTVEHDAESFPDGTPVYQVAHLARSVETGEDVVLTLERDGEVVARASEVSPAAFDCLGSDLAVEGPGDYAVVVSVGDEVLAEGAFDVTPGLE